MRISKPDYFMLMAQVVAMRATCKRRSVGCVLVDYNDHVIATGYNGVPKGMPHCIDTHCPRADCISGQGLDLCDAIHAEQNALLQCGDVSKIKSCYTTTFPCIHCLKLLMNTNCRFIFYQQDYPNYNELEVKWAMSHEQRNCIRVSKSYSIEDLTCQIGNV